MTGNSRPTPTQLRLRHAVAQCDEWKAHYGRAAADNARLRARVEQLEDTVRLLRLQLPLMPYLLGPDPDGPDPRWAPAIPEQRDPDDATTRSPGR